MQGDCVGAQRKLSVSTASASRLLEELKDAGRGGHEAEDAARRRRSRRRRDTSAAQQKHPACGSWRQRRFRGLSAPTSGRRRPPQSRGRRRRPAAPRCGPAAGCSPARAHRDGRAGQGGITVERRRQPSSHAAAAGLLLEATFSRSFACHLCLLTWNSSIRRWLNVRRSPSSTCPCSGSASSAHTRASMSLRAARGGRRRETWGHVGHGGQEQASSAGSAGPKRAPRWRHATGQA